MIENPTEEQVVKLQFDGYKKLDQCPFGLFEYNGAILYKFPMGLRYNWFMVKGAQPENMHDKSLVRPVQICDVAIRCEGDVR